MRSFWSFFISLQLLFIFLCIYEHNRYIHHLFQKQRLEARKKHLLLKKNKMMIDLWTLKNQTLIQALNEHDLSNLQNIKWSSIFKEKKEEGENICSEI